MTRDFEQGMALDGFARRWFALLAVGSMAFTLFGSLVPFEFQWRTWPDACSAFATAMTGRLAIESRSDAVANVMLGVPLGFGLLGCLCADRRPALPRVVGYALLLLPACCAFAATVEFAQLYVPVRTCSGSDVAAQTIGSAVGMLGWFAFGQRVTEEIRRAASGSGASGRFLVAYVLLLGFIQALPFDLTLSPANIYHKLRDGRIVLLPFREFEGMSSSEKWERFAGLLKLAGLYIPVGLLAGCLPERFFPRWKPGRIVLAALVLPTVIEAGQLLVESRVSSATDVLVGFFAVVLGWFVAVRRRAAGAGMLAIALSWFALMAVASWEPLTFPGPVQRFDWIPGKPFLNGNPLTTLEDILVKLVLFALVGAVVARSRRGSREYTMALAVAAGLATSGLLEIGQLATPNHSPSITDVLLGGMGALAGSWTAVRVVRTRGSLGE
jgi:VanZ family protein